MNRERNVKILAIAPYEGMRTLIRQVAEKRTDADVTVYVGDMETGAEIARRYGGDGYDVIVSRGGTAEKIRENTTLPVVEIPLSVYDILRSIKLAENYNNKYAVIGFPAITKNAHFLCDVLRYPVDIFTIHTKEEAGDVLKTLAKSGYGLVLCDMIANSLATKFGISSMLIASGAESVESALDQAVQTCGTYRSLMDEARFYRTLLEEQQLAVFAYGPEGRLAYASAPHLVPEAVVRRMEAAIPRVMEEEKKRAYIEAEGGLYILRAVRKEIQEKSYVFYYVQVKKTPVNLAKNGVLYVAREEAYDEFFNSFYGVLQSPMLNDMTIDQYARSSRPLMVVGEVGTGKEQMVRLIYAKSEYAADPMVVIDCSRLHEKGWSYLLDNDNSPFTDENKTIYIKNVDALTEPQFVELFAAAKDRRVHQRNRLVFTFSYLAEEGMAPRCQALVNRFFCLTLLLPPLRTHRNDVPNLAALYISDLNMRMAKEIIGFEPDALERLRGYDWPCNFDQFKRVVNELVVLTHTPYIQLSSVNKVLRQETQLMYKAARPASGALDLNRTLEEINLDILRRVMTEENGNQSAAAKRLGISRTTLWRMLQRMEPPAGDGAEAP